MQRGATVDTPFCPEFFQIHFSQNRFHFRAKDFHSYEVIGLKFQKKKKSIPSQIQKLVFLYLVNLIEFIMEIKIGYPKLKMM